MSHKGDRNNFWPDFCAKNLERNYTSPPRKFVPSVQEISAIKVVHPFTFFYKQLKITMKLELLEGESEYCLHGWKNFSS